VDQAVALAEQTDEASDPALDARDQAIVELLYGCGLRVAELIGLDRQASPSARGWLDLDRCRCPCAGQGQQTPRACRSAQPPLQALHSWLRWRPTLAQDGEAALFVSNGGATPE
jgi:integrase/recombinase XerC